jgi:hypothetical protein
VLNEEENEALQYAYSLRKLNTVEVSSSDEYRVKGVLLDFKSHGKLRAYFTRQRNEQSQSLCPP